VTGVLQPDGIAAQRRPGDQPGRLQDADASSVLGKARIILDAFTVEDDELPLSELVRRTALAKATVHRLCGELLAWGLLERSGTSYRLGLRLFELGQRVPRQRILRETALPYLEDLLAATQETVHLAIREGLEVLDVEKIVGHRQVPQPSRIAGRLPLHCTATGKVLLAFGPPSGHRAGRAGGAGAAHPAHRRRARPARGAARARPRRGIAVESEETRLGYCSVARPCAGRTTCWWRR
jgi:DNA-binding IclR family transcriptional regulator